jgi:hypothetical protein
MPENPSVLVVCVHNAGRSQMAAAWLRHLAEDAVEVRSAGSEPADSLNPVVVEAMREVGIDITDQTPKKLNGRPRNPRTSSSPWAAATPARSSPASATKTGNSRTPRARTSRSSV